MPRWNEYIRLKEDHELFRSFLIVAARGEAIKRIVSRAMGRWIQINQMQGNRYPQKAGHQGQTSIAKRTEIILGCFNGGNVVGERSELSARYTECFKFISNLPEDPGRNPEKLHSCGEFVFRSEEIGIDVDRISRELSDYKIRYLSPCVQVAWDLYQKRELDDTERANNPRIAKILREIRDHQKTKLDKDSHAHGKFKFILGKYVIDRKPIILISKTKTTDISEARYLQAKAMVKDGYDDKFTDGFYVKKLVRGEPKCIILAIPAGHGDGIELPHIVKALSDAGTKYGSQSDHNVMFFRGGPYKFVKAGKLDAIDGV